LFLHYTSKASYTEISSLQTFLLTQIALSVFVTLAYHDQQILRKNGNPDGQQLTVRTQKRDKCLLMFNQCGIDLQRSSSRNSMMRRLIFGALDVFWENYCLPKRVSKEQLCFEDHYFEVSIVFHFLMNLMKNLVILFYPTKLTSYTKFLKI